MNKFCKVLFFSLTLFFLSLFFSSLALVESIQNFKSQITVNKNGSFDVLENIAYDFETAKSHGILRTIPLTRKVGELYDNMEIGVNRVERNNQGENYTVSYVGREISIKIGNADVLLMPNYNPSWYSGQAFYAGYFGLFNSMNASFATTVSRSSNWHSSSSGYSSS